MTLRCQHYSLLAVYIKYKPYYDNELVNYYAFTGTTSSANG